MSILDDAIREHLELKRAHGADESELKKLEDEAFGPPQRPDEPDPFAEAPTEFMTSPDAPEGEADDGEDAGRRRVNVADLQEAPPVSEPAEADAEVQDDTPEPAAAEEELPSTPEPESAAEPIESAGPSTEERHAIAEQPTQFFDVEAEIDADAPPTEAPSPSDEEILDEELAEPRLDSVEAPAPAAPIVDEDDEEGDDDFWSDQRLSDELDQALESPNTGEHAVPGFTDEHEVVEAGEHEVGADTGEYEAIEQTDEHEVPERTEEHERPAASAAEGEEGSDPDYDPDTGHEDVLEDTPEFLEETPEDDDLWFEQRPPKDFDFDD